MRMRVPLAPEARGIQSKGRNAMGIDTRSHFARAFRFGLKVVPHFENLSPEILEYYEHNPEQILAALERGFVIPPEREVKKPAESTLTFSVVATTELGPVGGRHTKMCLTGSRYAFHDPDFRNWLPKEQAAAGGCVITALSPSQCWVFMSVVNFVLGTGVDTGTAELGKLLVKGGHLMTLVQAEEMVERTEKGEDTGLRTDVYGNFFFTKISDPKNPVAVCRLSRDGRLWQDSLHRLDNGMRQAPHSRILIPNLDVSKLRT